eukprot:CAMPEP_0181483080 /NCGR_PEP_ID=MMETSP1110-20121109/45223_1 /TAXON_ID=174948 /ORGANISM="Symbiodinium sp., Strain CCMP421" /LENGTH=70 /DNA_ID=CAMNT_0023608753 /DNA_START=72 /DNA_END=284 /DNA_ORIENTATION=-
MRPSCGKSFAGRKSQRLNQGPEIDSEGDTQHGQQGQNSVVAFEALKLQATDDPEGFVPALALPGFEAHGP